MNSMLSKDRGVVARLRGFSLTELLVVVAVVAVLIELIRVASRGRNA